jgi:hypothetical protein
MTLEDQFKAARDISPRFGFMSVVRDGKTVNIPLLEGRAGALLVSDDQGTLWRRMADRHTERRAGERRLA